MKFNVWRIQNTVMVELYDVKEEETYEETYEEIRWDNHYASENNLMCLDCGYFEITDNWIYYPIYTNERKMSLNIFSIVTEKNMSERFDKIINSLEMLSDVVNVKLNIPIQRDKDKLVESLSFNNINGFQAGLIKYGINPNGAQIEKALGYDDVNFASNMIIAYEDKVCLPETYQSIERVELIVTLNDRGEYTAEMYDKPLETVLDLQRI